VYFLSVAIFIFEFCLLRCLVVLFLQIVCVLPSVLFGDCFVELVLCCVNLCVAVFAAGITMPPKKRICFGRVRTRQRQNEEVLKRESHFYC
jgi:hypothetical protein